ncbi:MAG: flagellar motor protein MotB [Terriglobales bacterium]
MRRRRKHAPHASHERWLVSYADFITLLFAFFVVLYSTAQVDKRRMVKLAAAIQEGFEQMGTNPTYYTPISVENVPVEAPPAAPAVLAPQGPERNDLDALRKELQAALAGEIANGEVALRNTPQGLVISLREAGFFDSGSAGTKASSQPAFNRMTAVLRDRGYNIRVEGYTDNVPIHNSQYPSNWELSTARATEMIRLLIQKYGFNPERLSAGGYAQFHPIASNDTAEGRAHNRRVDVVILAPPSVVGARPALTSPEKPSPERK